MILLINYADYIYELYETNLKKREIYEKLIEEKKKCKEPSMLFLFYQLQKKGLIKRIKFQQIFVPNDEGAKITKKGIII